MRPSHFLATVALIMGLMTGCSQPAGDPSSQATARGAEEPATSVLNGHTDDGLAVPAGDLSVLGTFDLWEDREGGLVCHVELESARTIGGHSIVFDEDCVSRLQLGADLHAWFAAKDGSIVLIDATRRVLVQLRRLDNGDYYASRGGGLENLNLTRPN